MPTQAERLAAVETELKGLRGEVGEIRGDVKTLLAAYNRHSGAARLRSAIWTGLVGVSAAVGGIFVGRGH
jgi:hypothetical protein